MKLVNAEQPTMYFIGVTTAQSSIMKVFPDWAKALGLKDTVMKGIDIPIHAEPELYREVVDFIKYDLLSMGALVTTHKIDCYHAAKDMFDYLDPYAQQFGELSSISKSRGKLCGHAKDPITCGMAMEEFVPKNYWKDHPQAGVFIMGAGGSAISMCSYLLKRESKGNWPAKIVVTDRLQPRLDTLAKIVKTLKHDATPLTYHLISGAGQNDDLLHAMPEGSLIINATGLGKDRPGSPLTDAAQFPKNGMAWEINYRGDLRFMRQALEQKEAKNLDVQDGWMYFIYGWTQVIAEVFHQPIQGELLQRMSDIAAAHNQR